MAARLLRPAAAAGAGLRRAVAAARPVHTGAPCCYNWRWPDEVGGGPDERHPMREDDDVSLRMRSFKQEGRVTPRRRKGKKRFTARDHEHGVGGVVPGMLRSDAWMLQKSDTFHRQAAEALGKRQHARARELFGRSLELHGAHARSSLLWARMEQRLGHLDTAARLLDDALAADPSNPYLLQASGVLEWERANHDGARTLFKRALRAKPRDAVTYQSWGRLEASLGNLDVAEFIFKEAIDRVPKTERGRVLHAWGELEAGRGEEQRARLLFLKGLQADPFDAHSYCSWGQLEVGAGDIPKARELFLRGVRAAPQSAHLLHAWAHMEAVQGEATHARTLLKQCLKVSPGNLQALDVWAKLERNEGDEEAEARLRKRMDNATRRAEAAKAHAHDDGHHDHDEPEEEAEEAEEEEGSLLSRAVAAGSERNIATARSLFGAALAAAEDEKDGQAELEVVLAWSAMELRFRYDINPTLPCSPPPGTSLL